MSSVWRPFRLASLTCSRLLYVFVWLLNSVLLATEWRHYLYLPHFIHSLLDEQLNCLHVWAGKSKLADSINCQMIVYCMNLSFYHLGVQTDYRVWLLDCEAMLAFVRNCQTIFQRLQGSGALLTEMPSASKMGKFPFRVTWMEGL